jgi:hypothetical protein
MTTLNSHAGVGVGLIRRIKSLLGGEVKEDGPQRASGFFLAVRQVDLRRNDKGVGDTASSWASAIILILLHKALEIEHQDAGPNDLDTLVNMASFLAMDTEAIGNQGRSIRESDNVEH